MSRPARIPDTGHRTPAVAQCPSERRLSVMRPIPRRGLSRTEAAIFVGVGETKFDELVATGRMPKPKRIDNRRVWDMHALDQAFDLLPDDGNDQIDRTWEDINAA
jgi:predicted DNA-binding transcriptional regulator AlpA